MKRPHGIPEGPAAGTRLLDNYGRSITYLRLSITDRCNLRCRYCRPEEGVPFVPHTEILSFEELERLTAIFCRLGVDKVRVTGGEPFARKDCLKLLNKLRQIPGLRYLHITTNGVATLPYLESLAALDIDSINLSLDTLDPDRFLSITRRDNFHDVMQTMQSIIAHQIPLKVNSVILADTSDDEILRLAGLAEKYPITVRFIEKMPFSGTSRTEKLARGNLQKRLQHLFPQLAEYSQDSPATARIFTLEGFKGRLGIIEGYSRMFCTTCNKVRITPAGMLKTCLYDEGVLDLRRLLRDGATDSEIASAILECIQNRCANGHAVERITRQDREPSMASIGG